MGQTRAILLYLDCHVMTEYQKHLLLSAINSNLQLQTLSCQEILLNRPQLTRKPLSHGQPEREKAMTFGIYFSHEDIHTPIVLQRHFLSSCSYIQKRLSP